MKHKSFSICRYNFPKNIVENTTLVKEFNDNGSISKSLLIKRGIGSENLSEVVIKMFELSKSNGNQKLLTGQNVYYATNYPVKASANIFGEAAYLKQKEGMERSFDRLYNSNTDKNPQHGRGIIHSLAYQHTNITEVCWLPIGRLNNHDLISYFLMFLIGWQPNGSFLYPT